MKSLGLAAYATVHKTSLSVEELADRLGVSASLLYRAANPEDPGADLKLSWLIPLLSLTRNYSILHHLAHRLGFVCVKIPRASRMKTEELAGHQKLLADYMVALHQFLAGELGQEECLAKVNETLTAVAGAKRMVERASAQADLFEEQVGGKNHGP